MLKVTAIYCLMSCEVVPVGDVMAMTMIENEDSVSIHATIPKEEEDTSVHPTMIITIVHLIHHFQYYSSYTHLLIYIIIKHTLIDQYIMHLCPFRLQAFSFVQDLSPVLYR